METQDRQVRKIFQGFLSLTAAKVVFMLAGYVVYFSLPRLFDSPEDFGNYGVVIGLLNVFNMVLITGTIQAVSKFTSEQENQARAIRRAAYKIQAVIGGSFFIILMTGAPIIAGGFGDDRLIPCIRAGAFIPLCYAFYAVLVGSLNGQKKFTHQASLDMTFAGLKTVGILTLAALGFGVTGALSGFATAAFLILVIAGIVVSTLSVSTEQRSFPVKRILSFEIWVIFITLLINLLINADLFFVKSLVDPSISSLHAGYYTAVQTFARIPYTLVIAISLIVYPLISKSTFNNDLRGTQTYIRNAIRLTLLIAVPVAVIFASFPSEFLQVVYPAGYTMGADALRILSLSEVLLALLFILVTMITGSGHPKVSLTITFMALIVDAVFCKICIPVYGIRGAAIGSGVGWGTGVILAGWWIYKHFKMITPVLIPIRIGTAGILAMGAGTLIPGSGFAHLVIGSSAVVGIYGLTLWGLREIQFSELKELHHKIIKK
jgi:O-antigen/teichoic acid export membrane protein